MRRGLGGLAAVKKLGQSREKRQTPTELIVFAVDQTGRARRNNQDDEQGLIGGRTETRNAWHRVNNRLNGPSSRALFFPCASNAGDARGLNLPKDQVFSNLSPLLICVSSRQPLAAPLPSARKRIRNRFVSATLL